MQYSWILPWKGEVGEGISHGVFGPRSVLLTGATTEELTRKVEELIEMPIITTSTELVVARLSIVSTPTIDKLGHLRPPGNYRNLWVNFSQMVATSSCRMPAPRRSSNLN